MPISWSGQSSHGSSGEGELGGRGELELVRGGDASDAACSVVTAGLTVASAETLVALSFSVEQRMSVLLRSIAMGVRR